MNVRVRGIYATALTGRFLAAGHDVVQASGPVRRRFEDSFDVAPSEVAVESSGDRRGVRAVGAPGAVASADEVLSVARDSFRVEDPAPRSAVFDAAVTETLGGGAVLDLGEREGYLPFGATEERIEVGDELRVQVAEPAAPWADRRPELDVALRAPGGLATLRTDVDGTVVAGGDRVAARELAGMTDLLDADLPDGWGVEWNPAAAEAELEALRPALERAADGAAALADLPGDVEPPRRLAAPEATAWVRFGRESRFALDDERAGTVPTMPGHHRAKAGSDAAGAAVDFVESVCPALDGEFPFAATARQFGPAEGDRLAIEHGKPDGRQFTLGRGRVSTLAVEDREVTVRREITSSGRYDGLGTEREPGDVAITRLREGRWWYPTAYRGADGERKGTYVNVCTPVELFPDAASYVDLYVDVVQRPDGEVEVVDEDELRDAVADGHVAEGLAEEALDTAASVADALDR